MKIRSFLFFISLLLTTSVLSQEKLLTMGIHFKPLIAGGVVHKSGINLSQNNVQLLHEPVFGYSGGMVIRRGITNKISIEGGLSMVRRNFQMIITDSLASSVLKYRSIAYELPALVMVYIRLAEKLYMNNAIGFSLDMFPSHVGLKNDTVDYFSSRRSWLQTAAIANVGYEYRAKDDGIFYLGATFHIPMTSVYFSRFRYSSDNANEEFFFAVSGTYLTLDFRYFFHEEPIKKKKKKDKE